MSNLFLATWKRPNQLFSGLFSFSLTASIMLYFHVQIQWTVRSIILPTALIRTPILLCNFISASSEMLLPSTHISFHSVVLRLLSGDRPVRYAKRFAGHLLWFSFFCLWTTVGLFFTWYWWLGKHWRILKDLF